MGARGGLTTAFRKTVVPDSGIEEGSIGTIKLDSPCKSCMSDGFPWPLACSVFSPDLEQSSARSRRALILA